MVETAAYIDMIGGVSGDMLLGAMVGVGLELEELQVELDKLPDRGYRLVESRVVRGGLEAVLVEVELDGETRRRLAVRYLGEELARGYLARTQGDESVSIRLRPRKLIEFNGRAGR